MNVRNYYMRIHPQFTPGALDFLYTKQELYHWSTAPQQLSSFELQRNSFLQHHVIIQTNLFTSHVSEQDRFCNHLSVIEGLGKTRILWKESFLKFHYLIHFFKKTKKVKGWKKVIISNGSSGLDTGNAQSLLWLCVPIECFPEKN